MVIVNRSEILKRRKTLNAEERLRLSDIISDKVTGLPEYINADTVLIYADYNGEVATDRLICRALLDGKKVYAPVSDPDLTLQFYRVFALDELNPGNYGIREPLRIEYLRLKDSDITGRTVCITPGSVFDRHCNRMGYGKGFYDRFFAKNDISVRIGLAFELQLVEEIDTGEHDIPMTAVVTENEIIRP